MKKTIILIIALLITNIGFSQDFIYLKDGSMIQGTINEVNIGNIIYTNHNNPEGPTYSIKTEIVSKIVFANGYVREFGPDATSQASSGSSYENEKDNYFALGVGVGRSYGGLGLRAQGRFGKQKGLGLHLGYGRNPGIGEHNDYGNCWALGVKYFYYRGLYVNGQVGTVAYEEFEDDEGYHTRGYFGASVLAGGDFFFNNDHGGLNVALGITFGSPVSAEIRTVKITFDLGYIFKF